MFSHIFFKTPILSKQIHNFFIYLEKLVSYGYLNILHKLLEIGYNISHMFCTREIGSSFLDVPYDLLVIDPESSL